MQTSPSPLAAWLRKLRESSGRGLSATARTFGMDRGTLCRYELGLRTPDYDALRALLDRYGCTSSQRDEAELLRRQQAGV